MHSVSQTWDTHTWTLSLKHFNKKPFSKVITCVSCSSYDQEVFRKHAHCCVCLILYFKVKISILLNYIYFTASYFEDQGCTHKMSHQVQTYDAFIDKNIWLSPPQQTKTPLRRNSVAFYSNILLLTLTWTLLSHYNEKLSKYSFCHCQHLLFKHINWLSDSWF